jgi:hypothetical protein
MREPHGRFWESLREAGRFFTGCGKVHHAMRELAVKLDRANIPYAVVGGMAVNAHGHRQTTDDTDVLLSRDSLARFQTVVAAENYELQSERRWRFLDRVQGTPIDTVITGTFPGWLRRTPVVYPNPADVTEVIDGIRYVNLRTLVELKLAMHRYRDRGDVTALIGVHNLDESFADQLDPSVRPAYIHCLEEKRREDEYEARNG